MNYQIVKDEEKLREFIDWLPTLAPSECFLVSLFSRKKYFPLEQQREIKGDKSQLKRFTTNKEFLFNKIKQLEVAVGTYVTNDVVTPESTLALYITVNPRSNSKAARALLKELADIIGSEDKREYNLHKLALNATQVACGRKLYMDFDFDHRAYTEVIEEVKGLMNADAFHTVVTRGGCHILVEVAKIVPIFIKTWYQAITKLSGVDVSGDVLLPVPGCVQGGFVPYLVSNEG
jgi:hypothetical protein